MNQLLVWIVFDVILDPLHQLGLVVGLEIDAVGNDTTSDRMEVVAMAPLVLPPVVTGFALLWALGFAAFTPAAAVIASMVMAFPLYVRAVRSAAEALLRRLTDIVTRPEHCYTHTWQDGDLVMWDNRAVLHRGRPWDEAKYPRVMHRTTVAGLGPSVEDGKPLAA